MRMVPCHQLLFDGMTRDRKADLATLRAIHDAAQSGDFAKAVALAQPALEGGLEHPLLFNVVALNLERDGKVLEAVGLLSRAVELAPNDKGVRNALGLCLLRVERPAEALAQFAALLALDPSLPFAHTSHGAALLALGSITDAEASYRRALKLDPGQSVAMAGLAHIASRRAAYSEARNWAEKALAAMPNFPDAMMSLAATELGEGNPAKAEQGLRALLSVERLEPLDRAYANGLLGDVLDAEDRLTDAFAAYTACNDALRRIHADRFGSGQSALEYVRAMTGYFEHAQAEDWKPRAGAGEVPAGVCGHVFLLGFPRSGTTLLEVVLEGHPDIVSLEENESLIHGVHEFMRGPEGFERLSRATPGALQALREAYWQLVADAGVAVAGKTFVDKHPLNTLKLPLIARLFPDARIVFACRDPRDVVLSCFRRRFRMSAPMYEFLSLDVGARYYDAVMRLNDCLTGVLALDTCLVRHEDLVTGFTREMKRICAFLGIEWVPAMGDFALRTQRRAALTPSTAQLARGLNTEGIGCWRRYQTHMAPVLPALESWVKRFGYRP
jgi:tetratricopeptide (TPR) repeat protein